MLAATQPRFLATRQGKLTLALLCGIAFLDFVDGSITNVALPSIRNSLHFSVDGLTWIPSAYFGSIFVLASAVIALRATNTRGETDEPTVDAEPEASLAA